MIPINSKISGYVMLPASSMKVGVGMNAHRTVSNLINEFGDLKYKPGQRIFKVNGLYRGEGINGQFYLTVESFSVYQ